MECSSGVILLNTANLLLYCDNLFIIVIADAVMIVDVLLFVIN